MNNVNFSVSVGTVVPTSVRVVAVPDVLIRIRPEFRDHLFFVVRDDIVIVDHSHRIVAVVPAGDRVGTIGTSPGAQVGASSGTGGMAAGSLQLSEEEIRQLQIALNAQGFDVGAPDGRLGPRTMTALRTFQQQQGLQVTGRIDSQTVTALGVNVRGMSGGQQPSTTGQGPAGGMQQQPSGQAPAQQQQGMPQGGAAQQAPANPPAGQQGMQGGGQPSTTGQGSDRMQQQPQQGTQGGNQPNAQQQNPSSSAPSGQSK